MSQLSPEMHLARILNAWHEGGDHERISYDMEQALCDAESDFDGPEHGY